MDGRNSLPSLPIESSLILGDKLQIEYGRKFGISKLFLGSAISFVKWQLMFFFWELKLVVLLVVLILVVFFVTA